MHPGAGEAQDNVTWSDLVAGEDLVPVYGADAKAGEIVVAFGIHARHFGRLAADQRAARLPASFGDRGDDLRRDGIVELPGRVIVEEEQRLRALDDQIVGAHGDKVDPDAVVPACLDRQLELGADSVIGGDEQRVVISRGLQVEEAAEAAEFGIGAWPRGRAGKRANGLHKGIPGVD